MSDEVTTQQSVNDNLPVIQKPYAPLIGYLDLEGEPSPKLKDQLDMIWSYLGEETKSDLISERLHNLRQLENRLSPPKIGESRLGRLAQYIKAQQVVADAEKWRNSFYKEINVD